MRGRVRYACSRMSDANNPAVPFPGDDDWSGPSGDLLVPLGDVLGVRFLHEQIGGPFTAFMVEIPTGIRPHFKLADVSVGEHSVTELPYGVDPTCLRIGQWVELGADAAGHVVLAVMCVGRVRPGSRDTGPRRFRGVLWLRDQHGRLWGEAVGWVGQEAVGSFSVWRSS